MALTLGGVPLDLTDCAVQFKARKLGETTLKVNATADIVGAPTLGIVEYVWLSGDTDTVGLFDAEWVVTTPSGVVSAPTSGFVRVCVSEGL